MADFYDGSTLLGGGIGDNFYTGSTEDDMFIFGGSSGGSDTITGGGGNDIIAHVVHSASFLSDQLVTDFDFGDSIRISGTGEAIPISSISSGDGSNIQSYSVQIGSDGQFTTFIAEGNGDTLADVHLKFPGVFSVDNFSVLQPNAGINLTDFVLIDTMPTITNTTTEGDDNFTGGVADDAILGFGGNDTLYGEEGNDAVGGGSGDDAIYGGSGNDWLYGDDGHDALNGGEGNDTLSGGDGNDWLHGNQGIDSLLGGGGNDTIYGGKDNDFLQGNQGNDWLNGNNSNDTVYGGKNDDTVRGGKNEDFVNGNNGNDFVYGDKGNDTVHGGKEDDYISGGSGDDYLYGDKGNDTLNGGDGIDIFVFNANSGIDVIEDFTSGIDKISIATNVIATASEAVAAFSNGILDLGNGNNLTITGVFSITENDFFV